MIDISLIPKKEVASEGASNTWILSGSIVIFIIVFLASAVLMAALILTQNNIRSTNSALKDLEGKINSSQATLQFSGSVLAANALWSGHRYPSHLLDFLEQNTQTNVQWTDIAYNASTHVLTMGGTARDLLALAQQIKQFESLKEVSNIQVSSIAQSASVSTSSPSSGENFKLTLSINYPDF